MSEDALLEVSDLHCVYGRKIRALKGVSLRVKRGEIVALIGNNGAGKTTLMRAIAGQLAPESGRISFDGRPLAGLRSFEIARAGLSLVPEGRRIFPRLTVLENLEMGAFARGRAGLRQELDRLFALFPVLGSRRGQLGGTLSGGEQQMLAMARALIGQPKLLMLDEPSMGLAPVVVDRVFETIARINRDGVTVFLVEQNARRALQAAARGYVLETGCLVMEAPAPSLLDDAGVRKAYLGLE